MSAAIFSSELSNIIQDSKKKFPEIKSIAEKSLQELKSLPSTSEAQFAADFRRRPHLVDPLVASCKSKAPKLVLPAVTCLQRLVVVDGIAPERLQDVLNAIQECASTSNEVQLKILQSLPLLLQRHGDDLEGSSQAAIVQICLVLQQLKAPIISNTASATLSQVISLLFEKLEREDGNASSIPVVAQVKVDSTKISVRPAAHDAYRIFQDICLMTRGHQTQFVRRTTLPANIGLELLESIIGSHSSLFEEHAELASVLRSQVLPLVDTILSERQGFQVTVRAIRVFCLLLQSHLHIIEADLDGTLGDFNYVLEHEPYNSWRRVLYMEALRIFYSSSNLALNLFSFLDQEKKRSNFLQENLAFFVRLVAERPALLGIGQQSSLPTNPSQLKSSGHEQDPTETSNAPGIAGGEFGVVTTNAPGLSAQYSMLKNPCLEQVDKVEPPQIPETYIHSLSLLCITALTEALAKIILPLAMERQPRFKGRSKALTADASPRQLPDGNSSVDRSPSPRLVKQSQMRGTPTNPLELEDHPAYATVKTAAVLIESCWPAILATCSTLLYAALDSEFYRTLIRAIQKFTQIAGILRLSTPRDALLTTLSKAAVPSSLFKSGLATPSSAAGTPKLASSATFDSSSSQTTTNTQSHARRGSLDASKPTLSQRNLMCLRALVNLAIALGPMLNESWNIVLECLQRAHILLTLAGTTTAARDNKVISQSDERQIYDGSTHSPLASEVTAVESAVSRLFQSTKDYTDEALSGLLGNLRGMLFSQIFELPGGNAANSSVGRKRPSISVIPTTSLVNPQQSQFVIARVDEIAKVNIQRLCSTAEPPIWQEILGIMMDFAITPNNEPTSRLMAAELISSVCTNTILVARELDESTRRTVQSRAIGALHSEVCKLYEREGSIQSTITSIDIDIHRSAMEAIRAILERAGDSIITGWKVMFEMAETVFESDEQTTDKDDKSRSIALHKSAANFISLRLSHPAFSSVQLICSEFLESAFHRVSNLLKTLHKFAAQKSDLNMSLTTLTLIWNVSDYLQTQIRTEEPPYSHDMQSNGSEEVQVSEKAITLRRETLSMYWVSCLESLTFLVLDARADVRNGSIHTLFRALDGAVIEGELEGCPMLQIVLQLVTHNVLQAMLSHISEISVAGSDQNEDLDATATSASVALTSFTNFVVLHLKEASSLAFFEEFWSDIIDCFAKYVEFREAALTSTIFKCLSSFLNAVQPPIALSKRSLDKAGSLWAFGTQYNSTESIAELRADDLSQAQLAYVEAGKEIYRLMRAFIREAQLKTMVENLHDCILYSKLGRYESDVYTQTNLQSEVLKVYDTLQLQNSNIRSHVITNLALIVRLPFEATSGSGRPSFVALAKATVTLLEQVLINSLKRTHENALQDVATVFNVFVTVGERRYDFKNQGKAPLMWQLSLNTIESVISKASPFLSRMEASSPVAVEIWHTCVRLANVVQVTEQQSSLVEDTMIENEEIDLNFIHKLRSFMEPALLSLQLPQHIRETYATGLFVASIVHSDQPQEHLEPNKALTLPTSNIYTSFAGQVSEPLLKSRLRMCYDCLDELFRLACDATNQLHRIEQSTDKQSLNHIAFNLCVQRSALVLNKYIADQSLRGRMPAPMPQRNELLEILDHIAIMRCKNMETTHTAATAIWESQEVSQNSHSESSRKLLVRDPELKHLELLIPLIHKAHKLASYDADLRQHLGSVIDTLLDVSETR